MCNKWELIRKENPAPFCQNITSKIHEGELIGLDINENILDWFFCGTQGTKHIIYVRVDEKVESCTSKSLRAT